MQTSNSGKATASAFCIADFAPMNGQSTRGYILSLYYWGNHCTLLSLGADRGTRVACCDGGDYQIKWFSSKSFWNCFKFLNKNHDDTNVADTDNIKMIMIMMMAATITTIPIIMITVMTLISLMTIMIVMKMIVITCRISKFIDNCYQ